MSTKSMETLSKKPAKRKYPATSTVGQGRAIKEFAVDEMITAWSDELISIKLGDSLQYYQQWDTPTVIVSDGGYGLLGFEGDTSDHLNLSEWYEPHIAAWSKQATPATTLWFWNSEIGWATVHPLLEKYGWRYVNANIWNKGKGISPETLTRRKSDVSLSFRKCACSMCMKLVSMALS